MTSHLPTIEARLLMSSKTEKIVRSGFENLLSEIRFMWQQNNMNLLSVSTGDGIWDYTVAKQCKGKFSIIATDIVDCPVNIIDQELLQRNCNWRFVKVEAEQPLPFEDNTFDLVFHEDVVEHVTNPHLFISEQCRVLKPGGYLIFGTPNLLRPANVAKLLLGRLSFPVKIGEYREIGEYIHVQEFAEWQLKLLTEEAGLKVIKIQQCFWGVHYLNIMFQKFPSTKIGKLMCHHINVLARK